MSCLDVAIDSLAGDDVYTPGRWKPLRFGAFQVLGGLMKVW
jgi:hypothetical protein